MEKIIYSVPNLFLVKKDSTELVTAVSEDDYEISVFHHSPTGATFVYEANLSGTHSGDDDPTITLYGSRRALRKLERLLSGEKSGLFDRISDYLLIPT